MLISFLLPHLLSSGRSAEERALFRGSRPSVGLQSVQYLMCRDRAHKTISDPRPTSRFRSETTISISETEKSRPRRGRRHGTRLVYEPRSSDSQASAHAHLSSAATLSAPSRPQFPHLHKEGFLEEHQFPCGEGQGHSHRPWLIIRVRAKAGLGSCQSTSPCDPQTSLGPSALWERAA